MKGSETKGKAQLSLALDRISERITLTFQTLSPPRSNPGSTTEEQQSTLYFNMIWRRESVSQLPLMYKPFFIPARGNLRSWLPAIGKIVVEIGLDDGVRPLMQHAVFLT